MKRTPVTSSNVASIGYDPSVQVLEVEFLNGSIYQYAFVAPVLRAELMLAQSIGNFIHTKIKPATVYRRVEDTPSESAAADSSDLKTG